MSNSKENKPDNVKNWLKNLAQESWQLELLVSAFTIFLLLAGREEYRDFYSRIPFEYDLQSPINSLIYIFLGMVGLSLSILIISLISHLLLRGFWIGTIGLRSVQDHVDWDKMKYSDYFTERLKKKVRNLDELVVFLDDICSVIFSFSFLLISIVLAFGLTLLVGGTFAIIFQSLTDSFSGFWASLTETIGNTIELIFFICSIIYMIDFFTLGFFKKFRLISKIYYPIYKFFGIITLSGVSRSIYYHLISRFSKKRIRIVYLIIIGAFFMFSAINFDQDYYFSSSDSDFYMSSDLYDDMRTDENDLIYSASVPSMQIDKEYISLFIRYNPNDNSAIEKNCPQLQIDNRSIWRWNFSMNENDSNIEVNSSQEEDSDAGVKLDCLVSIYQIKLNDQSMDNLNFSFHTHPITNQKGILTMLSADLFKKGENHLQINKSFLENDSLVFNHFVTVKIWK